jgi:hypothetical protein
MLLVLIILQLMPAPAKDAMAEAVRDRHSWQGVRTELEPQWTVSAGRIESRRPTITLVAPPAVQPVVDPRSFSLAKDLPAGPKLGTGLLRDVMQETMAPVSPVATADPTGVSAAPPLVPPAARFAAPLLGDLRYAPSHMTVALAAEIDLPTTPEPSTQPRGFPGVGIGSPVPEPSVISLTGIAIPLILSRRRRWKNPVK